MRGAGARAWVLRVALPTRAHPCPGTMVPWLVATCLVIQLVIAQVQRFQPAPPVCSLWHEQPGLRSLPAGSPTGPQLGASTTSESVGSKARHHPPPPPGLRQQKGLSGTVLRSHGDAEIHQSGPLWPQAASQMPTPLHGPMGFFVKRLRPCALCCGGWRCSPAAIKPTHRSPHCTFLGTGSDSPGGRVLRLRGLGTAERFTYTSSFTSYHKPRAVWYCRGHFTDWKQTQRG